MKGSTIILLPFSSKILYCLLFSIGFFTNFIMELIILIVNLGFYEDLNSFQLIFKEYGKGAVRIHLILMSNMFCVKFPWFDTVNCWITIQKINKLFIFKNLTNLKISFLRDLSVNLDLEKSSTETSRVKLSCYLFFIRCQSILYFCL